MTTELLDQAEAYFNAIPGVRFDALLAPIPGQEPAGLSLRAQKVYQNIDAARRYDDPSLPMDGWEHDLKRAEWGKVSALALDALAGQSKDMQLVAWLLEAQINQRGFNAIAPCLTLMRELCERYWDGVHPQPEGGDLDHRANIVTWINEKLLITLRLLALTASGRDREYAWTDWEQARRNEQMRGTAGGRVNAPQEGATSAELLGAIGDTPLPVYTQLHDTLGKARAAVTALAAVLDERFAHDPPSLGALDGLLGQIDGFVASELHKRGVRAPQPAPPAGAAPLAAPAPAADAIAAGTGPIRDRADAYARLADCAQYLQQLEPHSPVPYLVRRAAEWGAYDTAQLYEELFLRLNGQLNIFELVGIAAPAAATHT